MKFVSLYAGIEGIGLGFEKAGMECVAQVEVDLYCNSVRQRHYPHVKQYGDIRDVRGKELPAADVYAGGFPCQDLSVAGKRKGLAGKRSGLWGEFARLIDEARPQWILIENVPWLLSSGKRRDWEYYSENWPNSGIGGPTGCLTLNTTEWPKDADVCSLSDILQNPPIPSKYFLSQKAAIGILRRAEKRGKKIPEMLEKALLILAGQEIE
jgi:site-specific DNA-cytosine methylase